MVGGLLDFAYTFGGLRVEVIDESPKAGLGAWAQGADFADFGMIG